MLEADRYAPHGRRARNRREHGPDARRIRAQQTHAYQRRSNAMNEPSTRRQRPDIGRPAIEDEVAAAAQADAAGITAGRPEMRASMRDDGPRERAAKRAAELRGQI